MRPKLKYFIQCDDIRNDQGKFSALGIFDTIYSLFFPANHPRFFLLLGFTGDEGTYPLDVQISGPQNTPIAQVKGQLQIASGSQVSNVVFCFEKFPLATPGRYMISLFLEGDFLAEYPFFARPPFESHTRSPEEIQTLLRRDDVVKSANADVVCPKCQSVYRFQHNLDPSAPVAPGFLALPPGDFFACSVCFTQIPIAQLRENLSRIVGVPRAWLDAHFGKPPQGPPPSPPGSDQTQQEEQS